MDREREYVRLSKRAATAVVGVTAVIAVLGVEAPAMAADSSCELTKVFAITKSCNTGSVKSNKAHDLRAIIFACKGSPWKVWDTGTGKTVASGTGNGKKHQSRPRDQRALRHLQGPAVRRLSSRSDHDPGLLSLLRCIGAVAEARRDTVVGRPNGPASSRKGGSRAVRLSPPPRRRQP